MLCTEPSSACFLLKCDECPGLDAFREMLSDDFKEQDSGDDVMITFTQWVSTDRCNFDTFSKPLDDFLDYFITKLKKLIPHHYISNQQSDFIKNKKASLRTTEVLVQLDFAENYSCEIQNAAQSYHWNKNQVTIHPLVVYYKTPDGGELRHYNYVIISESLHHDTTAVHLFITKMMKFLTENLPTPITKVYYVSDGAASQYKNKSNFMNILQHKEDFDGISCEWHFHATSHGKGPCDGIGGILKRKAFRASLTQQYTRGITNAKEFFEWANSSGMDMNFEYCSITDHEEHRNQLFNRFTNLKTIRGTQGFHAFIPSSDGFLKCKIFSSSEEYVNNKL